MANHPNRGKGGRCKNPTPKAIRAAREAKGMTQAGAAALICSKERTWQDWEAGVARMHPAFWHLFQLLTGMAAGMIVVPSKPTEGILDAIGKQINDCMMPAMIYEAMLEAAKKGGDARDTTGCGRGG